MQKNTAGKWVVFAFEDEGGTNPGEPVTGDAANITANVRIDGGAANAVDDTNPTELEDGYYIFDITAAEANGDNLCIAPASSTANVNVIGVPGAVWTTPANFNDLAVTATDGRIDVGEWLGTAVTLSGSLPDVNVEAMDDNVIAAAKIAANAITAAKIATNAITSDELDATAVTEIWNKVIETEGSYTAQQALSIALSALAGVTSNGGATLETPNGVANRIVATVNGSNERTAITLTPSS